MRHLSLLCGLAIVMSAASASAATRVFTVSMSGAEEVPPVTTTASGNATVSVNDVTGDVTVTGAFTGLTSNATAAHIHNSLRQPALSLTVPSAKSGAVTGSGRFGATDLADVLAGTAYINVHSVNFPNGEVRGAILAPPPTPAPALSPAGLALLLGGMSVGGALVLLGNRRSMAA